MWAYAERLAETNRVSFAGFRIGTLATGRPGFTNKAYSSQVGFLTKAELQAKMGDQLVVTDRVVGQPQTMSGFDVSHYVPKSLHGTQVSRDVTLIERLDILTRAVAEMLNSGLPRQTYTPPD